MLIGSPVARAQTPTWQTVVATGSNSIVYATASNTVGGPDVYVGGSFTGTANFDGITLTSAGGSDAFVAKWSPASNRFTWAQRAGGAGDDETRALTVRGASVYAAGNFGGPTAAFGANTLTNAGGSDIFVAKLIDAGATSSYAWAAQAGGPGDERARAVALDSLGSSCAGCWDYKGLAGNEFDVYVAGLFNSPTVGFGATTLASAGGNDGFVAKLTDDANRGFFIWAQRAGGTGDDGIRSLAVSGASVYAAGYFNSPTVGFGTSTLTNAGGSDVFVAKLNDAGTKTGFVWAQQAGGTGDDRAQGVAAIGSNIFLVGFFGSPTVGFGATTLASAGGNDGFVAKLTDAGATGSFAWAQRAGGPRDEFINAVALRSGNSVYVAGSFASPVAGFGTTTLTNANGAGGDDVFVAKLKDGGTTGSFVWAQQAGGTGDDRANAVAVSGTRAYAAGSVTPPANFGNQRITSPTGVFGFLASLSDVQLATRASSQMAEVSIYPNPAHAKAVVRVPAVPGAAEAQIRLTDAVGRVVRSRSVVLPAAGTSYSLALEDLAPGLYILHVQARATYMFRRFVVE